MERGLGGLKGSQIKYDPAKSHFNRACRGEYSGMAVSRISRPLIALIVRRRPARVLCYMTTWYGARCQLRKRFCG